MQSIVLHLTLWPGNSRPTALCWCPHRRALHLLRVLMARSCKLTQATALAKSQRHHDSTGSGLDLSSGHVTSCSIRGFQ